MGERLHGQKKKIPPAGYNIVISTKVIEVKWVSIMKKKKLGKEDTALGDDWRESIGPNGLTRGGTRKADKKLRHNFLTRPPINWQECGEPDGEIRTGGERGGVL